MKTVQWIYNGSLLLGIAMTATGAGLLGGAGAGLMTAGGLVLAFTIYGVERLAKGRS